MIRLECQACGGQYDDVSADGVPYTHVCPPVTYVAVTRGGKPGLVPLGNVRPTDVLTVERAGKTTAVAAIAVVDGDLRLGDQQLPRSNGRNENATTVIVDGVRTPTIIADGAGVLEVVTIDVIAAPAILDDTDEAIATPPA